MEALIIIVFVVGYLAITLEHSIKIDKLIPALVMMAISWALISLGIDSFTQWFNSEEHGLVEGFCWFCFRRKNGVNGKYIIAPFR